MEFIDFESLQQRQHEISHDFQAQKPFKYVVFDGFFKQNAAEVIHQNYPVIEDGVWDGTTYINQKNKFQKSKFENGSVMQRVFDELNSSAFLRWLEAVTGIRETLIADEELFGGGLHQSVKGAFLNVHVDFNMHPKTNFHRRLNVLIYMNKDWKDEYEGHLELWDFSNNNKKQLAKYAPIYNRCVIFETNEISYHGHPSPLQTPPSVSRKSLAVYYFSEHRPESEVTIDHNTKFVNTEGVNGFIKRMKSGAKAFFERLGLQ
jgi:Rps23 Pro-64 3,4-dihydroxylase Tpa1-like proline 4-hydroxylase